MTPRLCDRAEERWPFDLPASSPLELQRPAQHLASAYSAVRAQGAYTQRSRLYARVFHHLFFGPDPFQELRLTKVRSRTIGRSVQFAGAQQVAWLHHWPNEHFCTVP